MHILHIGERSTILRKSCAYIAHWGNKYNLAHILRIEKEVQAYANPAHILRIEERSTILRKCRAYIAHWRNSTILRIYCALGKTCLSSTIDSTNSTI